MSFLLRGCATICTDSRSPSEIEVSSSVQSIPDDGIVPATHRPFPIAKGGEEQPCSAVNADSPMEAETTPTESTVAATLIGSESSLLGPEEQTFSREEEVKSLTLMDEKSSEELDDIHRLVQERYDILRAGCKIDALEENDVAAFEDFQTSPLFEVYARRLRFYKGIGNSCCAINDDWFEVFSDQGGQQTIHASFDPSDGYRLQYKVRAVIPAKLTSAVVVANEVQFMPEWNKVVVNTPSIIGRRTAHYMVLNYQMSALAGMFKVDVLSEIRRFTNIEGGFMAEHIQSVNDGHPGYKAPASGYTRPDTQIQNIWTACGPDHTVLMQVGSLKLPFGISRWMLSKIGGLAGSKIIGGLVKNSLLANGTGHRWEKALAEDVYGLYKGLDEAVASSASTSRAPPENGTVAPFDLSPCFELPKARRGDRRDSMMEVNSVDGAIEGAKKVRYQSFVA